MLKVSLPSSIPVTRSQRSAQQPALILHRAGGGREEERNPHLDILSLPLHHLSATHLSPERSLPGALALAPSLLGLGALISG